MSLTSKPAPRPWWVAVVSGMASYVDAAAITGFATAIVVFQQILGLNEIQIGMAGGALTASMAIGALVGGRLGDRFGRRPVFTATMVALIVGAVVLVFASSFPVILVGAIMLGFASGADLPVSLSTISEAATEHNRGRLIGFTNLLWMAGIIANILISTLVGDLGAVAPMILFGHIAVVGALILLGRLTIPESATWLAARAERQAGVKTVRAERASIRILFRGPYGTVFLALIMFASLTNLIASTIGSYGTYILVNFGDVSISQASLVTLPLLPVSIIGYLWFMKIADKPVRFRYFQAGGIAFVLSPLVVALFGASVPVYLVSLLLMGVGSAFAFEGIQRVWAQEQFPTLLRTTAQGSIIAIQRFTAAALASVTPTLLIGGPSLLFGILTVGSAIGVGWAWIVFRTRDRHDEFESEAGATEPAEHSAPIAFH